MRSSDVTFRRQVVDIETRNPNDDDKQEMDIIEITYPDGKVVAFPADHKSPETGVRYRDMFPDKYRAFKNGDPDPDRVAQLNSEINERKAELDAMREKKSGDRPITENLGYGKPTTPAESDHDNTKQAPNADPKKIDQPANLGKPAPAKPADPKAKEPV